MPVKTPKLFEFVALVAMLTALIALAIDTMLPALTDIGRDLAVANANDVQLIVPVLFLGLGIGQILVGPLSDSMGRKPLIYVGLGIFMLGSVLSMFAQDFSTMLAGRFLQGLGAAAPRIISIALVRDCYAGREMAKIMSFVMIVFILVPILAPAIGQGILYFSDWRMIFAMFLVLTVVIAVWFALRLPETLPVEKRTPFTWKSQWHAAKFVLSNRTSMFYTILGGFVFAGMIGYISSSQQILQIQYGLGNQFALYFGILAFTIGVASFANARWVMQYGMRLLSRYALITTLTTSLLFLPITVFFMGHPPLLLLMLYLMLTFFALGLLFGNMNALAMEPLGDYAGIGASIVGSISTLLAVPIGTFIALQYNHTVYPLVLGFFITHAMSYALMWWLEKQDKQ